MCDDAPARKYPAEESVLLIGTQFSKLYTAVDKPAEAAYMPTKPEPRDMHGVCVFVCKCVCFYLFTLKS
jgi:hypothetical protein